MQFIYVVTVILLTYSTKLAIIICQELQLFQIQKQKEDVIMAANKSNRKQILTLTQFAMLTAIEAVVCFTPLGSLPAIGPVSATLSALPVIVTALLMGTVPGAFMGFLFGLCSFIVWTFTPPTPLAFVFTPFYTLGEISGNIWSIVICFVPRILIGVVTGLLAGAFAKTKMPRKVSFAISGILGSLTNTFLVLGGIYVFFGEQFAQINNASFDAIIGILGMSVLVNGLPEAALGGLFGFISDPVKKVIGKNM